MVPNATKWYKTQQNMSLGSNGVDRVRLLRKIPMRHRGTKVCTSSARFAPSFVRQPNGPKCTQMVQNNEYMSLGSNGVDRVRSLRKIPMQLHGTNFCTSSARFAPSFVRQPNSPKCTQIVRNKLKHQFRVQCGGSGAFVAKNYDLTFWHELLHLFGPFCTEFRKATKRSSMHPNRTKHTKTSVLGPVGWIGCIRCKKFRRDFVHELLH